MIRLAAILATTAVLAGCSVLDAMNPFSGPTKKLSELEPLKSAVSVRTLWRGSVGKAGGFVFTPAVVGNSVFAAARDGTVARFDNGSQAWRISSGQKLSGGVGSDGQLVVVGTEKGEVLAFDGSGKAKWKARVSSEVLAEPAVAGEVVVVRSGDNRVFGFDAATGRRLWVYQRATPALTLRSNAGVTLAGRAALAGFPGGKLVAIGLDNGAALWETTVSFPRGTTELERVSDIAGLPVIDGRQVCAAAYQGRVACFDMNSGNLLWAREMSSSTGAAMDSRLVYVTDEKGYVFALDRANGVTVWRQERLQGRGGSRPVLAGELVFVADSLGLVHGLRRDDGTLVARLAIDGSAVAADLQRAGDAVVLQTRDGAVVALQP